MAQPKRRNKTQPLIIAEDLHKEHTTAAIVYKRNPQEIVYTEAAVIKILTKYGHPEPDFAGYAKIAKNTSEGYFNRKKELNSLAALIKKEMDKKGIDNTELARLMNLSKSEITRLLSGANMTVATVLRIERVLDIKLLNH